MSFIQLFQFILCISILVTLHEIGHFLPARWFKTRVEKFFLFFDPSFSIFSMKKINGKWQYKFLSKNQPTEEETIVDGKKVVKSIDVSQLPENDWRKHEGVKYGIGWLPLGGYVKIAGMVDESMDTEQLKKPAEDWEFRSKPAWQRLIIMLGGVTVNFFLAWIIYSSLSYFKGEKYHDISKYENGISVSDEGKKIGLRTGDKIIAIDGKPADRMETSVINILFGNNVTVLRDGKEVTFPVNEDGVADVIKANESKLYFNVRFPAVVDSLLPNQSAVKAGLEKGDRIVAVNGQKTEFFDQLRGELKSNAGKNAILNVVRNNQNISLNCDINTNGELGFVIDESIVKDYLDKTKTVKTYTLLEAIPRGFSRTIDALVMQVKQFKIIFNTKTQGYKKVGGPIAIIKQMPETINWEYFWSFTAMFSVWLAFLNLIPIPGLDGGHVVFTLWEMITRKPVPQKVLEKAQMIGVVFLLGLMILIFGNDIVKWIGEALGQKK